MAITILSKNLLALHSDFFFRNSLVKPSLSKGKKVWIQLRDSGSKFVKVGKDTLNISMNDLETSHVVASWSKVNLHISSEHQENEQAYWVDRTMTMQTLTKAGCFVRVE